MPIVPSVTMNGTKRSPTIRLPLSKPAKVAINTAMATAAIGSVVPQRSIKWSACPTPVDATPMADQLKTQASITSVSAMIEPIERSMPPAIITSVIPIAAMA